MPKQLVLEAMLLKCPEKMDESMINSSVNVNFIGKSSVPLVYLAASQGQDRLVKKFACSMPHCLDR
jgi:hypothetical protein